MDDSSEQEPLAVVQDSAGLGQYVRECLLHGNTPVSQVLQQLRLSTLDLSGYQLGMSGTPWRQPAVALIRSAMPSCLIENWCVAGLRSLAAALGTDTSLRGLVLADCCLVDGAGAVLQQLAASRLQFLDLSGNRLGLRCATALAAALQQPGCSLLSLKIADCLLGDKAGQQLVASLASASLAELQLAHNALGIRTATALGSCLHQNTSLLALDLSWNTLGPKGFAILAEGLIASGQVQVSCHADVCSCSPATRSGCQKVVNICRLLKIEVRCLHIQALDISLCGLQDSGANALAEVIADLTQLAEVAAAGNHFTASSADKLAEGQRAVPVTQRMLASVLLACLPP